MSNIWYDKEDEIVSSLYPLFSLDFLCNLLLGHYAIEIKKRAIKLGVNKINWDNHDEGINQYFQKMKEMTLISEGVKPSL